MNYKINIIDTQNNQLITQLEKAVRGGARLIHQGGSKKDGLVIVGTALELGIIAEKYVDGYLYDLFTGDETRYKVEIIDDNDTYIWQGYILPDEYSEPFTNTPVINITATDGLGRLKGKYLPDYFYKDEISVIQIICACLKLTGLDLNVRFSPAIENYQQKDYNSIFIHTAFYKDKDKKDDAYSILEELLKDMLCVVYQQDNYFNIEGINVRNLRVYKAKEYSIDGLFLQEVEITRLKKDLNGIATPIITMQPPYGVIEVNHEREEVSFAETIYQEKNDGWVSYAHETGTYATDWVGRSGFYAYGAFGGNTNVSFARKSGFEGGVEEYINIREQPYVEAGKKYKLELNFEIGPLGFNKDVEAQLIRDGVWTNPFDFEITITHEGLGEVETLSLFDNIDSLNAVTYREQAFKEDYKSNNIFYFIPAKSGLLDIKIFPLKGETSFVDGIFAVKIEKLILEEIAFKDTYSAQRLTDGYTLKKEHNLEFADDSTGQSKGFRLQKLNEKNNFDLVYVSIIEESFYQGKYYYTINLLGANLIKDNIDSVIDTTTGKVVEGIEVIYNWQNGQDHVIVTDTQYVTYFEHFAVRIYDYNGVTENRDYWEQWSDSFYGIEKDRYADVVANIYHRAFDRSLPLIQSFNVKTNVKFNDFVVFDWRNVSEWMLTNCEWDIDQGFTDISIAKTYYAIEAGQNIPPIVEAGNDIFISETANTATLTSEAYDQDGFISSYFWEELTNNGAVIANPNDQNINVSGLTGNFYTFRVTVTDNEGATASDTVNVYRIQNVAISLVKFYEETSSDKKLEHYRVTIEPEISEGEVINLTGVLTVSRQATKANITSSEITARIRRNGIVRTTWSIRGQGNRTETTPFSLTYLKSDVIVFELLIEGVIVENIEPDFTLEYFSKVEIDNAQFMEGFGNISGIPLMEQVIHPDE